MGPAPAPGPGCGRHAGEEGKLAELLETAPAGGPAVPPPVLQLFLQETSNRLSRIGDALRAGDLVEARRIAHSLQGASGLVGVRRPGALGVEVETACARGDVQTAEALLPALRSEFEAFRGMLVFRS